MRSVEALLLARPPGANNRVYYYYLKKKKVRTPFGRRAPRSRHTFSWTVDPVRVDCEQRLIYMRVGLIRMTTPNSQQIVDRRISFRCLWPP